jgi:hypothetical protein
LDPWPESTRRIQFLTVTPRVLLRLAVEVLMAMLICSLDYDVTLGPWRWIHLDETSWQEEI